MKEGTCKSQLQMWIFGKCFRQFADANDQRDFPSRSQLLKIMACAMKESLEIQQSEPHI